MKKYFYFPLGVYLKAELLISMVLITLYLTFLDYFPKWLNRFTLPLTVYENYSSSIFLPTLVISSSVDDKHPSKYEVISHFSVLIYISKIASDVEYFFMCL